MKALNRIKRFFNPQVAVVELKCNCGVKHTYYTRKTFVHKCECGVVSLQKPFPWSKITRKNQRDLDKALKAKK